MIDRSTGYPILKWDLAIDNAARDGDNDRALELSIWQRQYMEMFCDDAEQLAEWERRQSFYK